MIQSLVLKQIVILWEGCPRNKGFQCHVVSLVFDGSQVFCHEEGGTEQAVVGQGAWKGELAQGEIFKGGDPDFKNVCLR